MFSRSRHRLLVILILILWISIVNAHDIPTLSEPECGDLKNHTGDACEYVKAHCKDRSSILNYLEFYYCDVSNHGFGLFLMLAWSIVLFLLFGTTSSAFFVPNINGISTSLHIPETVASLLAALGNGATDIFSSLAAFMKSDTGGLAMGELVGAAVFILMVVVGVVAIVRPFTVARRPFLRDVSFFIGAVIVLIVVLADNVITMTESIVMIVYYLVYVVVVVGGHLIYRRMKAKRQAREASLMPESAPEPDISSPLLEDNPDLSRASLSNDDIRDDYVEDLLASMGQPVSSLNRHLHTHPELPNPFADDDGYTSLPQQPPSPVQSHISPNASISTVSDVAPQGTPGLRLKMSRLGDQVGTTIDYPDQKLMPAIIQLLFPWVYDWKKLSFWEKVAGVVTAPMWILLRLTICVVEEDAIRAASKPEVVQVPVAPDDQLIDDEGDRFDVTTPHLNGINVLGALQTFVPHQSANVIQRPTWHRWMTAINIFAFPLVMAFGFVDVRDNVGDSSLPIWALCVIVGLVTGGLFAAVTNNEGPPSWYLGVCYLGFAAGIVWIYYIANEVVGMLQALGLIFGISEAIMGLTFFAWGNSLGDLVTNLAMARMGYGNLAMGACFGSPMLNIVLGIGLSGVVVTRNTGNYIVKPNRTLWTSTIGLLVVLILIGIAIPLQKFRANRRLGVALLILYVGYVALQLWTEFHM